ncbi:hypothetical protein SLEP1_g39507 [Rubroshorea leprosula]|uniref:Beta-ketoacyl synthase N-terminal domain-containing protein n=1 Tax=Rubroshorea leprosula TaxID=152421 RepID=A0AAV5L0M7_9ROSI|nr:hypothetical protein SLEP1_g39507 [Rubroshorea leprosula]
MQSEQHLGPSSFRLAPALPQHSSALRPRSLSFPDGSNPEPSDLGRSDPSQDRRDLASDLPSLSSVISRLFCFHYIDAFVSFPKTITHFMISFASGLQGRYPSQSFRFFFQFCSSSPSHSLSQQSRRYRYGNTGLGLVTPLGCGVETTWKRLIEGNCGIRAITPEDLKMGAFGRETPLHIFDQLTSKVAATVPCGMGSGDFNEELWLISKNFSGLGDKRV